MTLREVRDQNPVGELVEPITAILRDTVVTVSALLERTAVYSLGDPREKWLGRLEDFTVHEEPKLIVPRSVARERDAATKGRRNRITRMKQAAAGWRL